MVTIGIVVSVTWTLVFGFTIIATAFGAIGFSIPVRLLLFILVVSVIPFLIYRSYSRAPQGISKKMALKRFEESKFPEQYRYIQGLYEGIPSSFSRPTLMYNLESELSAFTFGTRKTQYIVLSAGLVVTEFYENNDDFKSVMLHESAHVSNKDVDKAYLAASVMSVLKKILPAILAIVLGYQIYLMLGRSYYYESLAGYEGADLWRYTLMTIPVGQLISLYGPIGLFIIILCVILYALRNQVIQLREFYADARVLEWGRFSAKLERTLETSGSKHQSKFELLSNFHPSISERVHILKDNSRLFVPSLWSAFSLGFLYGFLEVESPYLSIIFLYEQYLAGNYVVYNALDVLVAIFFFIILMFAVSSSFHKSFLRDVFSGDKRHFLTTAALNIAKFSMIFSLGWVTSIILISLGTQEFFNNLLSTWVDELFTYLAAWAAQTLFFATTLLFLSIFGAMLIKRSFSNKDAVRNFLGISILSSFLYILNRFVAHQILNNYLLIPPLFLIFTILTYAFVRIRDEHRRCPVCGNRLLILAEPQLACPHCQNNLYSWAIYSF